MKDKEKQIEICENCKIKENCSHRILVNMEKCKVNDCDYFQNISADKEKQIEEMAKDLYGEIDYDVNYYSDDNYSEVNFDYRETAKNIVEKGWVKPSENVFILTDDNAEELANAIVTSSQMQSVMKELIKAWQKERVEKILKETMHIPVIEGKFVKVDDLIDKLKEIATREGVEIGE